MAVNFDVTLTREDKGVLEQVVGAERDQMTGDWIQLYNMEFHNLYFSPHIGMIKSRRLRWSGQLMQMDMRNVYKILVGKREDKISVGSRILGWDGNIKMVIKE
jgi:hypothetical protein